MRIITNFKDYYDGAAAIYRDDRPLYRRLTEVIRIKLDRRRDLAPLQPLLEVLHSMPYCRELEGGRRTPLCHLVAFCGRFYPVYAISGVGYPSVNAFIDTVTAGRAGDSAGRGGADSERYVVELQARYARIISEEEACDPPGWAGLRRPFNTKAWARWEQKHVDRTVPIDLFRHFDTPVFSVSQDEGAVVVTVNPCLADLGFMKVVVPFDTAQELDMFLGNQLARQEDPAQLSDELRRDAAGFNDRSFKEDSPGRKANRRANKARKRARREAVKQPEET